MPRNADPPPVGERDAILKPMERRAEPGHTAGHHGTRRGELRAKPPKPGPALVARRSLVWMRALIRYGLLQAWDRLRGNRSTTQSARRLRETLTAVSSTGPKIARQLSMRLDLMPLSFAIELADVADRRDPMPLDVAVKTVEKATGKRLQEVFETFDPTPISSSTSDCIYQARLLSGEAVAVKVRRPGARLLIMADLVALGWQTRLLEALTIVRPGSFDYLRTEMLDLAHEELDYSLQTRYQTLFRQRARRDRVGYAGAPKVWTELSNFRVMVSGFVSGIRCSELVDIVERGDRAALQRLANMGIDPKVVARRLLHISWWSTFEGLFFLAEPSQENIVISPGNKITFLSFADCSTLSGKNRRFYRQMLTRLSRDDVSGAAQSVVQLLSPLPFIDVYEFSKRIEAGLWQELFAMRDEKAQWWERSTAGMWRVVLREARADGVIVRLDVLRLMRSALALDTIAARLNPRIKLLKEFRRYLDRANRRSARRFLRDASTSDPSRAQASVLSAAARAFEGLQRLGLWVESTVENLPVTNLALSGKAATFVAETVRLLFRIGLLFGVSVAVVIIQQLRLGEVPHLTADVLRGLKHPLTLTLVGLLILFSTRRVLFRLDDKGSDS